MLTVNWNASDAVGAGRGPSPQAQALGPPPRQLSPELRAWALTSLMRGFRWPLIAFMGLVQLIGPAIFLAIYFFAEPVPPSTARPPQWLLWAGCGWLAVAVLLTGGIVIVARSRGARSGRKLLGLLERGEFTVARVARNLVDYSFTVNRAPRRIIDISVGGRSVEIRTFDAGYASLFPQEGDVEVLFDRSMPDFIYPTSALPQG